MKHYILSLAMCLTVTSALLTGCSRSAESATGRKVVAVSLPPQKYLLEQIVGDKADIVTLLPPGANPESYEATVSTMRMLDAADTYFTIGTFPFESKITAMLGDAAKDKVVDTSAGLELIYGTHEHCGHNHEHGHHHGTPDPHTWSSVRNARLIASSMARRMEEADPANAAYYRDRAAALDARLDSMDRAAAAALSAGGKTTFAIWHPSLSYLARDYGLEQIAIGQEGKEMSTAQLKKQIDAARDNDAGVFFFQRDFDSRQAKTVCDELGIGLVVINPMNEDWWQEINTVIDALR